MPDGDEARRSIVGRGAADNPKNRFEKIGAEPDPARVEDRPETVYLRDHSRSIIAKNSSPDIGFDASINPYRGCSHGCSYCLGGDTPILMANGTTRRLENVEVGVEIYGTERRGAYRRYVKTLVQDRWQVRKAAYRATLGDGTRLVCSGDHRFLTERGWKFVVGDGCRPHLTTNNKLMGAGSFSRQPRESLDYKRGYACGMVRGDGHLASYRYARAGRAHGDQHQFRLVLTDAEALERTARCLLDFEVSTNRSV